MTEDFFTDLETDLNTPPEPKRKGGLFWWLLILLVLGGIVAWAGLGIAKTAPTTFPVGTPFVIEPGTSVRDITKNAELAGLVHTDWLLYAVLRLEHDGSPVQASTYVFEEPLNVFALAEALTKGDHDSTLIKLTIPEGSSVKGIAAIAAATLDNFDTATFLELSIGQEGYLFPETYLIPESYTATELYTLLNDTFSEQVQSLEPDLSAHSLTLTDIVILASIIEREANSVESMRMVSGILQERLRIGMALQVDASMEYVLEKPLKELTAEDLRQESAYNTYLNPGLPPTPIGNPGLESIKAVLYPTSSDYLFYITGSDGNFYYARTFDEHRLNIARYLR